MINVRIEKLVILSTYNKSMHNSEKKISPYDYSTLPAGPGLFKQCQVLSLRNIKLLEMGYRKKVLSNAILPNVHDPF